MAGERDSSTSNIDFNQLALSLENRKESLKFDKVENNFYGSEFLRAQELYKLN